MCPWPSKGTNPTPNSFLSQMQRNKSQRTHNWLLMRKKISQIITLKLTQLRKHCEQRTERWLVGKLCEDFSCRLSIFIFKGFGGPRPLLPHTPNPPNPWLQLSQWVFFLELWTYPYLFEDYQSLIWATQILLLWHPQWKREVTSFH